MIHIIREMLPIQRMKRLIKSPRLCRMKISESSVNMIKNHTSCNVSDILISLNDKLFERVKRSH